MEYIVPGNIITYWDATKNNQAKYMGEMLFQPKQQFGTELTKVGGRSGLPVQLKASAFDTPTTFRDRISAEVKTQTMPYFKEGMTIDEKTRQNLLNIAAAGNADVLMPLMDNIFDDTNNLLRGARVVRERMAMQLLSTGTIDVASNGVNLTYDYGIDEHQKVQSVDDWSDTTNAKPLQEIQNWVTDFKIRYGITLDGAIMSTKTFGYIVNNKNVKIQLYPNSDDPSGVMVQNAVVKQLIKETTGVTIYTYDESYATQVKGAGKRFFPDNVITFISGGVLGNMMFGTTPAQADLLTGSLDGSNVSITDTGVSVLTRKLSDPVNIQTIVSQICMPAFNSDVENGAGAILIANVVKPVA